jgi:hypothetical protein
MSRSSTNMVNSTMMDTILFQVVNIAYMLYNKDGALYIYVTLCMYMYISMFHFVSL